MDFKILLGLFRLGSIYLCLVSTWFFTALLFVPYALGPLLINLSQTDYWRSKGSQAVLLFASIAYAVFLTYLHIAGIVLGADAQSLIAIS